MYIPFPVFGEGEKQKAKRDFLGTTLAKFPNIFAKLLYVASLRDFTTGMYSHWGLEMTHGLGAAQSAIEEVHLELFRKVNELSLAELTKLVSEYFKSCEKGNERLIDAWRKVRAHNLLIPSRVHEIEGENFRINFQAVLAVLQKAPFWEQDS